MSRIGRGLQGLLLAMVIGGSVQAATLTDEEARRLDLRERAQQSADEASRLFASLGKGERTDEEKREMRFAIRRHLQVAIPALDELMENHPADEKWAEDLLEEVFAISFWVDRLSPLEDFEDPSTSGGNREDPAPPRHASAEAALEEAVQAQRAGDEAEAFYDYVEVVRSSAPLQEDQVALAHQRLLDLREELTPAQILSYLKKELKAPDARRRLFAVREMASLRSSRAARPLADALRREEDPRVLEALLEAFGRTQKRATARALERLARHPDRSLRLEVLDALRDGVGGRHGALAAVEFLGDDSPRVVERAISVMTRIGGRGGAEALGRAAAGRRTSSSLVPRLIRALEKVDNETAARMLVPHITSRGRFREAAEDALVRMGEEALLPCMEALDDGRYRPQAHYVLRRITDETIGMTSGKWLDWYRSWKEAGGGSLPCYERGREPWLGF